MKSQPTRVVSIDHKDSTPNNQGDFGSTLLSRPLDILFVLDSMAKLNGEGQGTGIKGLIDADNAALVGYSMGGYGVVNTLGGGFTSAVVKSSLDPPNLVLARRQAGNPEMEASLDPRIKAGIAIEIEHWGGTWTSKTRKAWRGLKPQCSSWRDRPSPPAGTRPG